MSRTVIGALRVMLGLDSAQFEQGLGRSKGKANKDLGDIAKSAARMGAAVAAALTAVAGAATAITMRVSSAANATGDVADRLGMNVEALQELRHAADRGGMGINNFDVAMRRFIRRSSEAAKGTGAAKGAFAELGIQLKDNEGRLKDSDALLSEVADAMQRVQDPADRLRLAFQMFDTDGAAMVNVLAGGSDELARLRKEARELGIVLDESTIRAAQRFHDNLDTLRKTAEGLQNRLATAVLPALTFVTDKFVEMAQVGGALDGVIEGVRIGMNALAKGVVWVTENIDGLINIAKVWIGLRIAAVVVSISKAFIAFGMAVRAAGLAKAFFTTISRANLVVIGTLTAAILQFTGHLDGFVDAVEGATAKLMSLLPEGLERDIKTAISDFGNLVLRFDEAEAAIDGVNAGLPELANQADKAAKATDKIGSAANASTSQLDRMRQMGQQVASSLASGFTNMITGVIDGTKSVAESFADMFRNIGQQFIQSGLQQLFSSLLGGLFGGGGFAAPTSFIPGGFFPGLPGLGRGIPGFEGGGFTGFGPRVGGLDGRGGILAMLHPNETVIDHTKGQGGPREVNFNITVSGARGNSEIRQMVEEGMDSALQTVRQHLPDWVANPRVKFV